MQLVFESNQFDDLVRYDYKDSYRNLVVKTHAAFEWFRWNCRDAKYLIKADEDAVLHLQRIDYFIKEEFKSISEKYANSAFCNIKRGHHPFRNPWSKLYVPFSSYSSFTLPDYCQGGSYMLTNHAVFEVLKNTELTNFIPLEDVIFTGIIGKKVGLNLYGTAAFCYEVGYFFD